MDKDNKIQQILMHLAGAASTAADGVTDAVQTAGHVVSEKYDVVKAKLEIARLQEEQDALFAGIGRTVFMVQTGDIAIGDDSEAEAMDAQQTIDRLLLLADQKQQEIDSASERLKKLNGSSVCDVCGRVAGQDDAFCPGCGNKLEKA